MLLPFPISHSILSSLVTLHLLYQQREVVKFLYQNQYFHNHSIYHNTYYLYPSSMYCALSMFWQHYVSDLRYGIQICILGDVELLFTHIMYNQPTFQIEYLVQI